MNSIRLFYDRKNVKEGNGEKNSSKQEDFFSVTIWMSHIICNILLKTVKISLRVVFSFPKSKLRSKNLVILSCILISHGVWGCFFSSYKLIVQSLWPFWGVLHENLWSFVSCKVVRGCTMLSTAEGKKAKDDFTDFANELVSFKDSDLEVDKIYG